jgi:hypothetical protein
MSDQVGSLTAGSLAPGPDARDPADLVDLTRSAWDSAGIRTKMGHVLAAFGALAVIAFFLFPCPSICQKIHPEDRCESTHRTIPFHTIWGILAREGTREQRAPECPTAGARASDAPASGS